MLSFCGLNPVNGKPSSSQQQLPHSQIAGNVGGRLPAERLTPRSDWVSEWVSGSQEDKLLEGQNGESSAQGANKDHLFRLIILYPNKQKKERNGACHRSIQINVNTPLSGCKQKWKKNVWVSDLFVQWQATSWFMEDGLRATAHWEMQPKYGFPG